MGFPAGEFTGNFKNVDQDCTARPGDVVLATTGPEGVTVTLPLASTRGTIIARKVDSGSGALTVVDADGEQIASTSARDSGFIFGSDGKAWHRVA